MPWTPTKPPAWSCWPEPTAGPARDTISRGTALAWGLVNRGEAMTCNMAYEDAAERIETFLGKRSAVWRGH